MRVWFSFFKYELTLSPPVGIVHGDNKRNSVCTRQIRQDN